jgi:hypothetical protein
MTTQSRLDHGDIGDEFETPLKRVSMLLHYLPTNCSFYSFILFVYYSNG